MVVRYLGRLLEESLLSIRPGTSGERAPDRLHYYRRSLIKGSPWIIENVKSGNDLFAAETGVPCDRILKHSRYIIRRTWIYWVLCRTLWCINSVLWRRNRGIPAETPLTGFDFSARRRTITVVCLKMKQNHSVVRVCKGDIDLWMSLCSFFGSYRLPERLFLIHPRTRPRGCPPR